MEHRDSLGRTASSKAKLQTKAASGREGRTVPHTPLSCTHGGHALCESEVHQAGAGCPGDSVRFTCLLSIRSCWLSVAPCWCRLKVVARVWQRKSKHVSHTGSAPSTGLRLVRSNSPVIMDESMSVSLIEVQKAGQVA